MDSSASEAPFTSPYPALVNQSMFGKHPTAAYVIPNTHLCYNFTFQRSNKNDTKYRCLACRPEKNVFITVKDNFFISDPVNLPHICSPKLLTREIIYRLASKKLKEIEETTGDQPKLYIEDLIPGAVANVNVVSTTSEDHAASTGQEPWIIVTSSSKSNANLDESTSNVTESHETANPSNNDQILDYIMYNFSNGLDQYSIQLPDNVPSSDSMDISVKIEDAFPSSVGNHDGPSTSGVKSEPLIAYCSENGDTSDDSSLSDHASTSKPIDPSSVGLYPALITQSKFGKHPSAVYVIPNTNWCYIFNFQRNNKDDKKYRCLGCRPDKNLFVTVKGNFFLQDPTTLEHVCIPKDMVKTLMTYKALEKEMQTPQLNGNNLTNSQVGITPEQMQNANTITEEPSVSFQEGSSAPVVKVEEPESSEYESNSDPRASGIMLEPSVTLFPATSIVMETSETLQVTEPNPQSSIMPDTMNSIYAKLASTSAASTNGNLYPALVNQSKFGKHPSATYVIPNTHSCYTFAFQRQNKNDAKYGCLACKRMERNVFINVKDSFFITDPACLPHVCTPKALPAEMATRLSYKKLQEIGENPNEPVKQPKRIFEDLILETEANRVMDASLREETVRCLEGEGYSKRRKAISRRVNKTARESEAADNSNEVTSNADDYLRYIMNNCGNSEEGRVQDPAEDMEQDSNDYLVKLEPPMVHETDVKEIKPGPMEPSTSFDQSSEVINSVPEPMDSFFANLTSTPIEATSFSGTPYPALINPSKFGKHPSATYVIPNTHSCYTFGFQRQNKNDCKYGCLACKRMERNVFVNVKDSFFIQDPTTLAHVCTPKELPKEMATRLSYKKLQEIEDTRYDSPKQPKKHFEDLIMETETNRDLDPIVREETAKILLGAGYLKRRTAISRRVNKKFVEQDTVAKPTNSLESASSENDMMAYIMSKFVNTENVNLPDSSTVKEEEELCQPSVHLETTSEGKPGTPVKEHQPTPATSLGAPKELFTSPYPALISQSLSGKHTTSAYVIPESNLCYTFSFQRSSKIGTKYRCLSCKPEKNVFAYVKDGYFLCNPAELPHCCSPKELPKELAARISNKNFEETEKDSLVQLGHSEGNQKNSSSRKRKSTSKGVTKRFKDSRSIENGSEDLPTNSNEDQIVNYIINNFVNSEAQE